jgi:hypothetical protein
MSAFLCNKSHITALAAYAAKRDRMLGCSPDPKVVGKMLHDENVKSFNYRYDDRYAEETRSPFKLCIWAQNHDFSTIQIIKAAGCLRYQSCEHPEYENSEAAKLVNAIIDQAVTELDGYETAAWEIQKPG